MQTLRYLYIAAIVAITVTIGFAQPAQPSFWVSAYYDVWQMIPLGSAWWAEPPDRLDYQSGVTHIIQFPNGNIRPTISPFFGPVGGVNASDSLDVLSGTGRANFTFYGDSLIARAHRAGVRVLLCVNAVSADNLVAVLDANGNGIVDGSDSTRCDVMVWGVAGFLGRHKYDGADWNIEHGGSKYPSKAHIALLVRRQRAALNTVSAGIGGKMTFTLSPTSGDQNNYPVDDCNANVDQINPQTYDNQYAWNDCINANVNWYANNLYPPSAAQLGSSAACFGTGNLVHSISQHGPGLWSAIGYKKEILGAGVSTYGRLRGTGTSPFEAFTRDGFVATTDAGINAMIANGGFVAAYDTVTKSNYLSGIAINNATYNGSGGSVTAGQGFYFTYPTPQSYGDDIAWLKANNFHGFMLFDYQNDADPKNPDIKKRNPLIGAAGAASIGGGVTPPTPCSCPDSALIYKTAWNAALNAVADSVDIPKKLPVAKPPKK